MSFELHVSRALTDNFVYAFTSGSECCILDPGEAAPVEKFLDEKSLKLSRILLTHHHWDHVDGVPELARRWKCEVWASSVDVPRVSGATTAAPETFELFGEKVRVLSVPGHTQGQIAYYFENRGEIFVGDTLFSAGCGRLKEGTPAQLHESLRRLKRLPSSTKIYFGHEYTLRNLDFVEHYQGAPAEDLNSYRDECKKRIAQGQPTTPTTCATELKINPFLRSKDLAEFTRWRELRDTW